MKLTESQRRAVEHGGRNLQLIAFTFTEEAAAEVNERIVTALDGLRRLVQPARCVLPLRQGHRGRRGGSASAGPGL
jgi:superfamily I DNA/RNA helicase